MQVAAFGMWVTLWSGCYLLDDGAIDETCEDFDACGDDGLDELPDLNTGIVLYAIDADRWQALAINPDLTVAFDTSGLGSVGGPIAFLADIERLLLADQQLFIFGPTATDVVSRALPTGVTAVDMSDSVAGTVIISRDNLFLQASIDDDPSQAVPDNIFQGTLRDLFVTADGALLYIVEVRSSSETVLHEINFSTNIISEVENDFVDDAEDLSGGGFIGPGGAFGFCDADGTIRLLEGGSPEVVVTLDVGGTVIGCAYDDRADAFLALTAQGQLLIHERQDGVLTAVNLIGDGFTALNVNFF